MARNWESMGLVWETETVKNAGKEFAGAEIPTVVDLQLFADALAANGGNIIAVINASNSLRVAAQDKKRRNPDMRGEELREAIWNGFCGQRMSGTRTPKVVLVLPNGQTYTGTDKTEFMAAWMAAAVDAGMGVDLARNMAQTIADSQSTLK